MTTCLIQKNEKIYLIDMIISMQSLTKWQNKKKALVNSLKVEVSEVVFCATIEWE